MTSKKLILPGLALALAGGAFAQGDLCSTATTISGTGTFAYDTTGFTTSGFNGGGTCVVGTQGASNFDGFFQWTVPANGDYIFDTNGTAYDTTMTVHDGVGCAATCIEYDDDDGVGLQSQVTVSGMVAGAQVLIQVSGFSGTTGFGPGTLNISAFVDPCAGAPDDSFEDNDTCGTATVLAQGSYTGLHVANSDSDFYSVTIPAASIMTWTLVADSNDTDFNVTDSTCGTLYGTALGSFTFTTGPAAETIVVEAVNWAGAALGCSDYDFDMSIALDPCQITPDDSYEENDDCATAAPVTDGTITGLYITLVDQKDTFSTCLANGATITVDILFTDAVMDLDLFLWDSSDVNCGTGFGTTDLANGFSVTDNETVTYTNTTGADQLLTIEVDVFAGGSAACTNYDLVVSGSGCGSTGTGVPFCAPGNNNSTGAPVVMTGSFGSGVGSDLHLEANGGPNTQFGYFLVGTATNTTSPIPLSNGLLCLSVTGGNALGRYNVTGSSFNSIGQFDASGVMNNLVGTSTVGTGYDVPSTVPIPGSPTITAGSTWHFQLWYRDGAAGPGQSNLSNGLSVTF